MRNGFLTTVSATALILGLATAHAENHADETHGGVWSNAYVSLFGGYSMAHDITLMADGAGYGLSLKDGFTIGGAFGTYLTPSLRGELEFSFQQQIFDEISGAGLPGSDSYSGRLDSYNVMLNLWQNIDVDAAFTPYVGAGIGASYAGFAADDWPGTNPQGGEAYEPAFVSQIGAGVRFDLSDRKKLDIGYRFRSLFALTARDDDQSLTPRTDMHSHSLQVGLTYMLGDGAMDEEIASAGMGPDIYYSGFASVVAHSRDMVVADGGYAFDVVNKPGFSLGGAVGTSIVPQLRAELEATYLNYAQDGYADDPNPGVQDASGRTNIYTLTANIWKDIDTGHALVPYVGVGVGVGVVDTHGELNNEFWDDTAVGMALQFGAGINYAVSENVAVNIGYRARGVFGTALEAEIATDHNGAGRFLSHSIQVGVIYGYGLIGQSDTEQATSSEPTTDNKHYVSLFGGAVVPEDVIVQYDDADYDLRFKSGFTFGSAIGTHIMDTVRGELEFAYQNYELCEIESGNLTPGCRSNNAFDTSVASYTVLANAWKDVNIGMFAPYIGGGLGLGVLDFEYGGLQDPSLSMVGQVGGGLRFAATESLTLDLGYRYKGFMDPLLKGKRSFDDYYYGGTHFSHNFIGGVSWGF